MTMIARKSTLIFLNNIVIAIFGAIALFFIAHYMGPEPLGIIGFGLGTFGLYFVSLYMLREFTRNDINFFLDTLNNKKMRGYILSEIKE